MLVWFQFLGCIVGLHTNIARQITESRLRRQQESSKAPSTASEESKGNEEEAMDTNTTESTAENSRVGSAGAAAPPGKPTASVAPTLKQPAESSTEKDIEIIDSPQSQGKMEIDLTDSSEMENGLLSVKTSESKGVSLLNTAPNGDIDSVDTDNTQSSQLRSKASSSQGTKSTNVLSPRITQQLVKTAVTQAQGECGLLRLSIAAQIAQVAQRMLFK